jgi:hypothetical protein
MEKAMKEIERRRRLHCYSQKPFVAWLSAFVCGSACFIQANAQPKPGIYGPGLQFDVLNNLQVAEADVDYRFRVSETSTIRSFIWFDAYGKGGTSAQGCDGYGCGTGGSLDICLYTDDGTPGHLWTGKPLACVSDSNLRSGDKLRQEVFPSSPAVVSGTLYHLHWHNTDPNAAKNFVSVNDVCSWHPSKPRQPGISDTDMAVLSNTREVDTDSPIFQLNYANGAHQGQGYKESWIYAPEKISDAFQVREIFTVSGADRSVVKVSVRVNRISGAGPLTVTLANADGAVLEQGQIRALNFPAGQPLTSDAHDSQYVNLAWGSYTFPAFRTLRAGQQYELTLSAPADSVYQAYAIQRGSGHGFSPETFFSDGYGQFSHDGGVKWTGFKQTEFSFNHQDADIQFYFSTQ